MGDIHHMDPTITSWLPFQMFPIKPNISCSGVKFSISINSFFFFFWLLIEKVERAHNRDPTHARSNHRQAGREKPTLEKKSQHQRCKYPSNHGSQFECTVLDEPKIGIFLPRKQPGTTSSCRDDRRELVWCMSIYVIKKFHKRFEFFKKKKKKIAICCVTQSLSF